MIKINLIDYRRLKKVMQVQKELGLYLLLIVAGLGIIGYVWNNKAGEVKAMNSEITVWKGKLTKINEVVQKVDEAKAKNDRTKDILKSIRILKTNQKDPSQLLDEINIRIPSEIWLEKFLETDKMVILEGISFTDPGIATFMKKLENLTKYFSNIELVQSRQVKIENEKVRKFTIQCYFKPLDQP
jgi:Tfp pilus assembly protein PilN